MKLLIAILLLTSSICHGQVDDAINKKVNDGIQKFIQVVGFDTVKIKSYTAAATLDTLTAPNNTCYLYDLLITGSKISGNRIVAVTNTAGVYSMRFIDVIPFQGASTTTKFNTSIIGGRVVVSIGGATGNYTYQREIKNVK